MEKQWLQINRENNRSKYEIETVTKHKYFNINL